MEDYKGNSFKSREKQEQPVETRKVEKIVSGSVTTKKKNGFQKFAGAFFTEDVHKIKDYAVSDVIIPSLKKAISDIVKNAIDIAMYGTDARNRNINSPVSKISYKNYSSYSNPNAGFRTPSSRTTYSYDEIVLENRGEAEMVLTEMDEIISKYGFVKVADLYDLVGLSGSHTDNNYGWMDLRTAQVVRVQNGYLLKLPRALPID